jgi:putative hemolysin
MGSEALFWLIFNIISIIVLGLYSMLEMACVSFNKVRLQYYVSKGIKRAYWLNYLINTPSRLFGTTLIGVNVALVVGSECSRELYSSLGLDPDLSPLTQVILVVIFGELAPMFSARRYAESVAMLGAPILYASAKILTPVLWVLYQISYFSNRIVGGKENTHHLFLTQEDLQKILEEHEGDAFGVESDEFNTVSSNIFHLGEKDARQVMVSINTVATLPSNATVAQFRKLLKDKDVDYVPIYHREHTNIIGIAEPRDLIRASDTHRVRDYANPPWFITQHTKLPQILRQFRYNKQRVGIVINNQGRAIGLISLYDIMEEIFGTSHIEKEKSTVRPTQRLMISRTFPGDMKVGDFHSQYGVMLSDKPEQTLSELMIENLGHQPEVGDSIFIDPFEIEINEISLLDVKSVTINTRRR